MFLVTRRGQVLSLCLIVLSLLGSAFSQNVVISQVYGGGGNSGATLKNDFIELYNKGALPVNLSTWSVQYASSTGSTWQRTNLTGTINPGQYYLVQEAAGANLALPFPAADATGTIPMAAGTGKVALVSNQTLLTGTCPTAGVLDFVGYGSANCFEGSGPTAALTNTTAALRKANGCTDTNNNSADFATGIPSPRNTSAAFHFCGDSTPPTGVGNATPSSGLPGATVVFNVTVTPGTNPPSTALFVTADFTPIGGSAGTTLFDDGSHNDGAAGDKVFGVSQTVALGTTPGAKSISVAVSDSVPRSSTTSITFAVEEPPPPDVAIHDIQGPGVSSPYNGQKVRTTGIVTARKSNGFFLQARDGDVDSDPNTSEGIFVFTSSTPPSSAAKGNEVAVVATVQEFVAAEFSPPLTELSGTPVVTLISTGNTLPTPVTLTAADTYPATGLEQLERFEGMRVSVASLTTVAPTDGNVNESSATGSSNGVFYAVITGVPRPFREAGIEEPFPLPPGAPATVPRFDANPEKLRLDSDGQTGVPRLEVTSNVELTNVTGVMDYAFRAYTILPDATPTVGANMTAIPVPGPTADEFTVASFNMERFFDNVNDPDDDATLTTTAFNNRLNKASLTIRNVLRTPDVVGVQEMESLVVLQKLADKVNADAVAAGDPDPQYEPYLEVGNDPGGIDVGFLVKSARVTVNSVAQFGKDATYINPVDSQPAMLNDRPPLMLRATVSRPNAPNFNVTVIVNHMRSLNGVEDADGRVRAKRRAQAEYLAALIQAEQAGNPSVNIISVGDYNAFSVNDGYVDSMGTVRGDPAPAEEVTLASEDLVDPNLVDLATTLPADQQYSYVFDGNAQELDHALVNSNLYGQLSRFAIARVNSDFPETMRGMATRPERLSDHDPSVAYFNLPAQDFTPPTIHLTSPANATYLLGAPLNAAYTCEDASGVVSCEGPVADGAAVDTSTAGSFTFTVNATDIYGNASQASATYNVSYGICPLMNSAQPANSGSTIPVKLQICDANGNNLSAAGTEVQVVNITGADATTYAALSSGKANPNGYFRYSEAHYIFNLSTKDMPAGTYLLHFKVAGDNTVHSLAFVLK